MHSPPQISILVPCHNTGRFLPQTVDSILAQRFTDFELLLLDDGSTDGTGEVIRALGVGDRRIQAFFRENRGLVDTRNELLQLATARYISWHDSDDLMTPDRLHVQFQHLQKHPELLCVGSAATLIDPDGLPLRTHAYPETHDEICARMEREFSCYFGSTLMRRESVVEAGGFRHPFRMCEDFDLLLRLSEMGRLANLPDTLLLYRQHMSSTCNQLRHAGEQYARLARMLAAERRAIGSDRLQRGERVSLEDSHDIARETRVDTHRRWGWWALAAGHLKTARKYALHALREAPLQPESWKLFACSVRGH